MDFFEIIDTRKTNRKYEDYIPPKEDIKRIINSARLAPSAINAQNWKFIAIYNDEIKHKMAQAVLDTYDEILSKLKDEDQKEKIERYRGHSTFLEKAPVVIACIITKAPSFCEGVLENCGFECAKISQMRPDSQLLSMGGAIENMALSAHALNLGSCWMVAPILASDRFREILNINDDDRIVSLLTIGKPEVSDKRSPKKELDEIMTILD